MSPFWKAWTNALALIVLLTACHKPSAVRARVAPGSTAQSLAIELAPDSGVQRIRAIRVSQSRLEGRYIGSAKHTYWALLSVDSDGAAVPSRLRFGQSPPGFSSTVPESLTPGAYEIEIVVDHHSSLSYFTIANDGTVSP